MKPREFWIALPPFEKDPLGPCQNVMRLCASYEFEDAKLFREVTDQDQPMIISGPFKESVNSILETRIEKLREALDEIANTQDISPVDPSGNGPDRVCLGQSRNRRILEARDALREDDKLKNVADLKDRK